MYKDKVRDIKEKKKRGLTPGNITTTLGYIKHIKGVSLSIIFYIKATNETWIDAKEQEFSYSTPKQEEKVNQTRAAGHILF